MGSYLWGLVMDSYLWVCVMDSSTRGQVMDSYLRGHVIDSYLCVWLIDSCLRRNVMDSYLWVRVMDSRSTNSTWNLFGKAGMTRGMFLNYQLLGNFDSICSLFLCKIFNKLVVWLKNNILKWGVHIYEIKGQIFWQYLTKLLPNILLLIPEMKALYPIPYPRNSAYPSK